MNNRAFLSWSVKCSSHEILFINMLSLFLTCMYECNSGIDTISYTLVCELDSNFCMCNKWYIWLKSDILLRNSKTGILVSTLINNMYFCWCLFVQHIFQFAMVSASHRRRITHSCREATKGQRQERQVNETAWSLLFCSLIFLCIKGGWLSTLLMIFLKD